MTDFVEVKTSDLVGPALDHAVEVALGGVRVGHRVDFPCGYWCIGEYRPSTDWSQGGPLIEKHQISLDVRPLSGKWDAFLNDWINKCDAPLIAACRAIVSAKFGGVVIIPAELVKP